MAQTAPLPQGAGWLSQRRRHAMPLALLAPAAIWVVVRWWLAFRLDHLGIALPPELSSAGDPEALMRNLVLGLLACLAFGVLAWWLVRQPKPMARPSPWRRSVKWGLVGVWVLLWLAGAGQAVRSQFNAQGVQTAQAETLKLVGLRLLPPSKRSLGGAQLYLDWPAQGGLHTVVVENPSPELLAQPAQVALQLAPGRWQGWYVLGWRVPEGTPAAEPTTSAAPGQTKSTDATLATHATQKATP